MGPAGRGDDDLTTVAGASCAGTSGCVAATAADALAAERGGGGAPVRGRTPAESDERQPDDRERGHGEHALLRPALRSLLAGHTALDGQAGVAHSGRQSRIGLGGHRGAVALLQLVGERRERVARIAHLVGADCAHGVVSAGV